MQPFLEEEKNYSEIWAQMHTCQTHTQNDSQ